MRAMRTVRSRGRTEAGGPDHWRSDGRTDWRSTDRPQSQDRSTRTARRDHRGHQQRRAALSRAMVGRTRVGHLPGSRRHGAARRCRGQRQHVLRRIDMATTKQVRAAKRNVKRAQAAARSKRTIAHLPAKTRTALGKQGAAVARRKRTGASSPKTRAELYEEAKRRKL